MDKNSDQIYIDKVRLSQVLNNLLVNAIKYTEVGGTVILKTEKQNSSSDDAIIRFSVYDNGVGIAPELINKIKERYFTHHQKRAFKDSFGLGLSIVVQLLEHFKTELKVESFKDEGSVFYFDILTKLRDNVNTHRGATTSNAVITVLSNYRMLIIDDDEQIISLYQHLFGRLVKDLISARKVEEIPFDSIAPFDIVITDYRIGNKTMESSFSKLERICSKDSLVYKCSNCFAWLPLKNL